MERQHQAQMPRAGGKKTSTLTHREGGGPGREQSSLRTRWGLTCAPQAALEPWPSFKATGCCCGRPTQALPPRPALGTLALPLSSEGIRRMKQKGLLVSTVHKTRRADAVEARADGGRGERRLRLTRTHNTSHKQPSAQVCAAGGRCGPKSLCDLSLLGRLAEDQDTFWGP